MIELGGKKVVRVYAKHEPYGPGEKRAIVSQMMELGAPTIRCVEWRGELYALEGSHRLMAAHILELTPVLEVLEADRLSGEDERFWDRLKERLPHYAWEVSSLSLARSSC